MKRGGKDLPEEIKKDELEKLAKIVSNVSLSPDQLKDVIQRIKKPSYKDLSTTLHKFSSKSVKFLILGDIHLNAYEGITGEKLCDFKRLKEVLHIGKEEGAQYILQTGDVTDGENMRSWQKYNLVKQGFDRTIEFCVNEWPESDLPTYFIAGNHDLAYFNSIGADICKYIAEKRNDLIYLGINEANLPLQPEYIPKHIKGEKLPTLGPTWIRIRHPSKGTAKAQSYQPQSHIEAAQSEFKPNILIIGHYHKMDYLFERNVHCFQAGTFEKQSDWMRTHDLAAHLGAWLVTAYYKENGTIDSIEKRKLLYEVNGKEVWGIHNKYGELGVTGKLRGVK